MRRWDDSVHGWDDSQVVRDCDAYWQIEYRMTSGAIQIQRRLYSRRIYSYWAPRTSKCDISMTRPSQI